MTGEGILREKKENKIPVDYEYISNDPEENADNFHPKWALFREMRTDEERYKMLRQMWGSTEIPDPRINLTCSVFQRGCLSAVQSAKYFEISSSTELYRQTKHQSESDTKENQSDPPKNPPQEQPANGRRRKMQVSRRRSRSCTRPYEQLISNLQKDYQREYSKMVCKHRTELQEMLLAQLQHAVMQLGDIYAHPGFRNFGNKLTQNLQFHQEQEVNHLLSSQYRELQRFLGEKNENFDACKRYMEEVKAFFTFYQKINDDEVTLQMTDEQYEHTVETDRMYSLYSNFYR